MGPDDYFPYIQNTCKKAFHCDVVLARYSPCERSVVISQIISLVPMNGNATRCLQYLVPRLKHAGLNIVTLIAKPLPNTDGPNAFKLMMWYRKFGFNVLKRHEEDGSYEMVLYFPPKPVQYPGQMLHRRQR